MARKRKAGLSKLAKRGGNSLVRVAGGMGAGWGMNLAEDNIPWVQGKPGRAAGVLYIGALLAKVFLPIPENSIGSNLLAGAETVSGVEAVSELVNMGTRTTPTPPEVGRKAKSPMQTKRSLL